MWALALWMATATRMPSYMTDVDRCQSETAPIAMPCSLPVRFSQERLQGLLGSRKSIWWIAGDRLTMVARYGDDPWGALCCAIQASLDPIGDTGLGAVTVRVPRLDEALLDISYESEKTGTAPNVFRGARAPAAPAEAKPLRGRIVTKEIDSRALGERRKLDIYLPEGIGKAARLPVIYLADGDTQRFAPIAEAAVRAGKAAPAIIVGLHPGENRLPGCNAPCDERAMDYVIDASETGPAGDTHFSRHLNYVVDEVIPYVEATFPASRRREDRMLAGYSNGASWALATAELRPDLFGKVLAMSGGTPRVAERARQLTNEQIFAGAGLFEPNFRSTLAGIVEKARGAGAHAEMHVIVSGHSHFMWDILFEQGIETLLPPTGATARQGHGG